MTEHKETFIQKARREQIIAAAIDTIVEIGYAQASLAEIAKRAGVVKTVIPYYFENKDALIRHIIIHVFMGGAAFIQPQVDAAPTPTAKLDVFIKANVAYIAAHPKEMAAAFDIAMNAGSSVLEPLLQTNADDPRLIGIKYILQAGQQTGEFRTFDPHIMAVTITQAIDGVHGQLKQNPALDLVQYGNELAATFARATRAQ